MIRRSSGPRSGGPTPAGRRTPNIPAQDFTRRLDHYDPGWTPAAIVAAAWDAGAGGLGANLGYSHTVDPGTRDWLPN